MSIGEFDLQNIALSILASPKYRHVCPDLVQRIVQRESLGVRNKKEAEKAARNRLHQVCGAYLDSVPPYAKWTSALEDAPDASVLQNLALEWMRNHSSTRERLPVTEQFYAQTISEVGTVSSVIDIACGLNPLALPWMGLPAGTKYYAYDLYVDMAAFLNLYLQKLGMAGCAFVRDCGEEPPDEPCDLAMALKFLPVLEQQNRGAALNWMRAVRARTLLISYPTRSLGGRDKGMAANYEARFIELVSSEPWSIRKLEFETELCFVVSKVN